MYGALLLMLYSLYFPYRMQTAKNSPSSAILPSYTLRNHIPLAAPATREPTDGSEPFLRVSLGFTPRWYRSRLGIDFSEPWHHDPVYRYETLLQMKELLHDLFPKVPYFTPRYIDQPYRVIKIEPTCATISGVNGIMTLPAIYGIPVVYSADGWPDAKPGVHIPKEELAKLSSFNLDQNPVVQDIFRQMDTIEQTWGMIHGYLNYQGILNIALKVRGNEIFLDLFDDPPFVKKFFRHIALTIEALSKQVQARQRETGFHVNLLSMSNCVMNMVSPEQYEEFVLPLDLYLSTQYERFGIHTCNWDATPYLEQLRKIQRMGYLDTGIMADLARIKSMFPETRRAVLYSPVQLENNSEAQILADLKRIANEYAPCDVVMADVEDTTLDSRVRWFLEAVEKTESRYSPNKSV